MKNVTERKCRCGNNTFTAHQLTRHDILVNSAGAFLEDKGIYDAEYPYGPFTCTVCGAKYEELCELDGWQWKRLFQPVLTADKMPGIWSFPYRAVNLSPLSAPYWK